VSEETTDKVRLYTGDNERHGVDHFGDSWCMIEHSEPDGEMVNTGETDITCSACKEMLESEES